MHRTRVLLMSPAHGHLLAPRSLSSQLPPSSGVDSARHLLAQLSLSRRGPVCALRMPWLRGDRDAISGLCLRKGDPSRGLSPSGGGESGYWVAISAGMMEKRPHSNTPPGSGLSANSLTHT